MHRSHSDSQTLAYPKCEEGIRTLLARYESEPSHVHHVQHLALNLFDSLRSWHGLGSRQREQLHAAALLHDIGWAVTQPDGRGHHKASARLIREHPWEGVDSLWVQGVAQIARYHRKNCPLPHHRDFAHLSADTQEQVRVLAALLRVADGLDRRHLQKVQSVVGTWRDSGLELIVFPKIPEDISPELIGASRKADLLRQRVSHLEIRAESPRPI